MRWLGVLAAFCGCSGKHAPPREPGPVTITLETEKGQPFAPSGATSVEVVFHERDGDGKPRDVTRSANVKQDGSFDLGDLDPSEGVAIEITLHDDSGAAVGYGRTERVDLAGDAAITVQVRRPIAYFAGTVSRDADGNPDTTPLHWTLAPATFSDLTASAGLDGKAQVGSNAVLVVAAGPNLYMVTQATSDPSGALTGPAQVLPIATGDHTIGAALAGTMTGAVLDGAGADDGAHLAIGTATQLFAIDGKVGTVAPIGDGSFSRVAILTTETGEIDAVAIKNRGATTGACSTSAELWWATLAPGAPAAAHLVATGGFSDVATDRGRAFYVDACKGELGEVTATSTKMLRAIAGTGTAAGASAGKPTALAVSNGQAYIGVEIPSAGAAMPATTSLRVTSIEGASDAIRTLWTEAAQQVLDVADFPDVRRQLSASSAVVGQLEIGAGGDYIALTTTAHFDGAAIPVLGIPRMSIDTEELRVFAAATGGVIQRYRSWCDGILFVAPGDIGDWECAAAAGQSAPAGRAYAHHIGSMTFQFGKK